MQNWCQNDAKSHQKSLKLAILGSNVTHVSANLALSWHIWPPTWPQLNPSWRQVGMTSPILGQSSPQLRHPGATLDQTIAKGQCWNKFGTILAPFWDSFGTISAPFGEHLCCFYLHFNNYFIYFAIRFPTLDIDKYTTTSKRFCESISFLPWGRRQRRQPSYNYGNHPILSK